MDILPSFKAQEVALQPVELSAAILTLLVHIALFATDAPVARTIF
ncbi:MAG: hypothetical protein ACI901_000562 [Octadecabacter sp.]|jgi:hypothetical protein